MNVASLSGGKDSVAMILMLIRKGRPLDKIIYCDTGEWEMEEARLAVDQLEAEINFKIDRVPIGVNLTDELLVRPSGIKTGNPVPGLGWPSRNYRWCTGRKVEAMKKHMGGVKTTRQYIGIAYQERHRRDTITFAQSERFEFPLCDYRMDSISAIRMCKRHGFYTRHEYDHPNDRMSCWCCPLQSLRAIGKLITLWPDRWTKMARMIRSCRTPFAGRWTNPDVLAGAAIARYEASMQAINSPGKTYRV